MTRERSCETCALEWGGEYDLEDCLDCVAFSNWEARIEPITGGVNVPKGE